jgi:hypothetical protein
MNITAWKCILTAHCLMASSISWAADQNGVRAAAGRPMAHQNKAATPADKSRFHYMDAIPARNTRHIRTAVMLIEKKTNRKNQCDALEGTARRHCFELEMPT